MLGRFWMALLSLDGRHITVMYLKILLDSMRTQQNGLPKTTLQHWAMSKFLKNGGIKWPPTLQSPSTHD